MLRMTATRQMGSQPDNPTDTMADALDSTTAAQILGMTEDGVRKRIAKGKLKGYKEHGRWYVYLPDTTQTHQSGADRPDRHPTDTRQTVVDAKELAIAAMEARIASLEDHLVSIREQLQTKDDQLQSKDTQIGQLHHLLAQTALNAAPARPWWRFW